jgi:tetratricopeptide (TPR) repeat protein
MALRCCRYLLYFLLYLLALANNFAYSESNIDSVSKELTQIKIEFSVFKARSEMVSDNNFTIRTGNNLKFSEMEHKLSALDKKIDRLQIEASSRFELTKEVQRSLRNRMSDTSWNINFWGVMITILGLIVAVGAVVGGFVSSRRTIEAAGEKMELWLKEHHTVLEEEARVRINKTVEESLLPAKSIEKQLGDLIGKAKLQVDDFTQQAKQGLSDLSERMADVSKVPTSNDIEQLHQSVKSLKVKFDSIPESLSADELFNLGLEAYFSKEYVSAIDYWGRVVGHVGKSDLTHLNALFNQGIAYGALKKFDQSINSYQQLIDQYAGNENTEIQYQVVRAIIHKGVVYSNSESLDQAMKCYQEIIDNYEKSKVEEIQVQVAIAISNKGSVHSKLQQPDQAMNSYQKIIDNYEKSEVEKVQVQVARAILNKGNVLSKLKQLDQAMVCYQVVVDKYGKLGSEDLQVEVSIAILKKGTLFVEMENPDQAIKCYQTVIDTYIESTNKYLQYEVSNAIYHQGSLYKTLKEFEMAIDCYQKLVKRNDDSEDEGIKISMASVINDLGFAHGQMNEPEKAIACYQKNIDRYKNERSPDFKISVEISLFNIAESFVIIKSRDEALDRVKKAQAVTQEGEFRYSIACFFLFMLADSDIETCLDSIRKLNDDTEFDWSFNEIREYVEKQDCSIKLNQLRAMINFFENHNDIATLEDELSNI